MTPFNAFRAHLDGFCQWQLARIKRALVTGTPIQRQALPRVPAATLTPKRYVQRRERRCVWTKVNPCGTVQCYWQGCRCLLCRQANTVYQLRYRRQSATGAA